MIVENALSLPLNIPLGLAITELIAELGLPTIAHHHDFYWERERYAVDAASDYLRAAFPPTLDQIQHIVINFYAKRQLALREYAQRGFSSSSSMTISGLISWSRCGKCCASRKPQPE